MKKQKDNEVFEFFDDFDYYQEQEQHINNVTRWAILGGAAAALIAYIGIKLTNFLIWGAF